MPQSLQSPVRFFCTHILHKTRVWRWDHGVLHQSWHQQPGMMIQQLVTKHLLGLLGSFCG